MKASDDIMSLKGIGEKTAKLFEKVGIRTIDDLLHYYPKGYDTYGSSNITPGIISPFQSLYT